MEQNVLNRYGATVAALNNRIAEYNADKEMFFKEFFTDEMKSIIRSVVSSTRRRLEFPLNDMYGLSITTSFYPEFFHIHNPTHTQTFYMGELEKKPDPDQNDIVIMENMAKNFMKIDNLFRLFVAQAEEFICDIVTEYRRINEDCMDRLNGVMGLLGEDVDDIKHIKITVEWI